jgi:Nif-specific regulatory protein
MAHFKLEKLISENNLAQSWYATELKTRRKCFIKSPAQNLDIDPDSVKSILAHSFHCQKALRSRKILTAHGKYSEDGELFIEYPYIDLSKWRTVTPESFWGHFPQVLLEVCIVIDYLHLMGLVHGDLTLSNILMNTNYEVLQVKLIDLDFLTTSHSSLKAKIFGTPEHMAPEILENDVITPESDNYSLGVCLKTYMKFLVDKPSLSYPRMASSLEKLSALAGNLTETDRLRRPRILTAALYEHKIVDRQTFKAAQKTLLMMKLSTSFRNLPAKGSNHRTNLGHFLTRNNKVFGLSDDLISDLDQAFKKNRISTLLLLKSLIQKAELVMCGDYWQLTVSDELSVTLFSRVGQILHGKPVIWFTQRTETARDVDGLVAKALQLKRDGNYLKSFLCLKNILCRIDRTPETQDGNIRKTILFELGILARILNRPKQAISFLNLALDLFKEKSEERLNILLDLILLYLSTMSFQEADRLISLGLKEAGYLSNPKVQLRFQKQRAWVLASRGEFVKSQEVYETLIARAIECGHTDLLVDLYSDLGSLAWRRGEFSESKAYLRKSVNLAKQNDLLPEAMTPTRNLSLLCHELSEYKQAVKYGKLAIRSLVKPLDRIKMPFLYSTIALANIRLGEYHKAEYWLHKSVAGTSVVQDRVLFGEYYQFLGWLQMNRGELPVAKESLHKALEVLGSTELNKTTGKVYHNLAEIALYEGDNQACVGHVSLARRIFEELGDNAACAEIELLGKLNNYYHDNKTMLSDLITQLESLVSHNSRYYALLCLFHILIHANRDLAHTAAEIASPLRPLIERSEAPLYSAVGGLMAWHDDQVTDRQQSLRILKAVYLTLERAGHTFLALLVCERIAAFYKDESKSKLAKKFLKQGLKLSLTLRNQKLIKSFKERTEGISRSAVDQRQLVQSIHGISEILMSITDYEAALQRVVQYAVDETGAERGVLLLKPDDKSELQVKAFVECDKSSLADIRAFSRTIPQDVSKNLIPLVIENALTDNRTKSYKSIVVHNILSVIGMPITIKDKLLGVLYLDHHTIPALFEKDDITFVSSIANFVSVILTKIQEFRTVNLTKERLLTDLSLKGLHQPLITQSQVMLDLQSRLPEIARTNASVLIVGESGTGKEILCEMIHDLSLRSDGPLIKLNCAAIASTLIESELFGVAKNVATGVMERKGKFSAADGGTLFLDEIGDLPLEIQAKVLRVLEYQQFERVGSNRTTSTDIRFIYATNKDLKKLIGQGKFRDDLYYRINTITIELPPLRERPDDTMLLVEHFIKLYAHDEQRYPRFSAGAIEALLAYPWPGNVRELRNFVEKLCILSPGRLVDVSNLPKEFLIREAVDTRHKQSAQALEKATIRELLSANDWNKSRVAKIMHIPLTTLRRKIKKYHITREP